MLKILELADDFRIPYRTSGNHHCRSGWVQFDCPFCDETDKWHLGYRLDGDYFVCWKCGGHTTWDTLRRLLKLSGSGVRKVLTDYTTRARYREESEKKKIVRVKEARLPPGTEPMSKRHTDYLLSRNYDPEELAFTWGLLGTRLSTSAWRNRVIAPIFFNGARVACTGRSVRSDAVLRWQTTPDDQWAISKKEVLYGYDLVRGDTVFIFEGPSDCWRIGPGAVGTMGTAFSKQQVNLLRRFRRRVAVYDSDAKKHAIRLCSYLSVFSGETIRIELDSGDVGDWSRRQAREFYREYTRRFF